eukprot:14232572-Alexandrium_andersonii.AAC.1
MDRIRASRRPSGRGRGGGLWTMLRVPEFRGLVPLGFTLVSFQSCLSGLSEEDKTLYFRIASGGVWTRN